MIDIYGLFKKLPGGSLLFPMFTVAIINTIFPNLFTGLGGMTMAMYKTGTLTVAGIILAALFLVLNVPIMLFTDKVVNRRPGYCAVAWCSVAGIAMSVPAMLATDEAFASYVADASAQIALCLIITSLVSPLITKWVVDKWGSPKVPAKKDRAAA